MLNELPESKIVEIEDSEDDFHFHEELSSETSMSSEDIGSHNTSNSSYVQPTSSSFNLRIPWKHEPVVLDLLNYYTEQVRF